MRQKMNRNRYFVCMNIEARKYHLIERVMQFDEKEIDKVETFLNKESELSASLDRALQQVEEGKVTPHNEVKKKYEKWL
ncbi:MAG: putative transcriptional regulator [Cyclobacteriaceae bacterium]|jgi:predicted transcriptional regulator